MLIIFAILEACLGKIYKPGPISPDRMLNKELQELGIYLKEYVLAESVVIL